MLTRAISVGDVGHVAGLFLSLSQTCELCLMCQFLSLLRNVSACHCFLHKVWLRVFWGRHCMERHCMLQSHSHTPLPLTTLEPVGAAHTFTGRRCWTMCLMSVSLRCTLHDRFVEALQQRAPKVWEGLMASRAEQRRIAEGDRKLSALFRALPTHTPRQAQDEKHQKQPAPVPNLSHSCCASQQQQHQQDTGLQDPMLIDGAAPDNPHPSSGQTTGLFTGLIEPVATNHRPAQDAAAGSVIDGASGQLGDVGSSKGLARGSSGGDGTVPAESDIPNVSFSFGFKF